MKTGPQKHRLHERLASEIEERTSAQLALMDSHMKSLESDIRRITTNALSTIEADTDGLLNAVSTSLQQRTQQLKRAELRLPGMIYSAFTLAIVLVIATTLAMVELTKRNNLTGFGISTITDQTATYLILDQSRNQMTTCRIEDRVTPCLRIKEE